MMMAIDHGIAVIIFPAMLPIKHMLQEDPTYKKPEILSMKLVDMLLKLKLKLPHDDSLFLCLLGYHIGYYPDSSRFLKQIPYNTVDIITRTVNRKYVHLDYFSMISQHLLAFST